MNCINTRLVILLIIVNTYRMLIIAIDFVICRDFMKNLFIRKNFSRNNV